MPLFALLAGAAGLYMRLFEIQNVFDEGTGLPQRGAAITSVLIASVVGFLIISLVFALRARIGYTSPGGFGNAYGTESIVYPFIIALFCLVWLGATVKHFIDLSGAGAIPLADMYFLILSGLSALSLLFFSVEIYQDPRRKSALALCILPILFTCYWLILLYKQNASNPVLLSYCYHCLAIIFSALSFYFTASFVFDKTVPGKAIFAYLGSIFFCMVTLADDHSVSIKLIFAAIIAINTVHSSMLIRNLRVRSC
jgi:hypothetical protein